MQGTGRVGQIAARALLVFFIFVPAMALLTDQKASLAWLVWAVVSLWTALNAVQITMLVFPERHSPGRALAIVMLEVANMVLSLALALLPTGWLSSFR